MIASVQRDDGAWVRLNTTHIVYVYPENGQPRDPAVIVLSTGDKLKIKDSLTDFFNKLEVKALIGE